MWSFGGMGCMKTAQRGKYLGREHAVELRRIIPVLPKVAAVTEDFPQPGGTKTACTLAG